MSPPPTLAISTSSCPGLGAPELADSILSNGGEGVELRYGRAHRWETSGAQAIAAAGVLVTAVASSRSLGVRSPGTSDSDLEQATSIGAPLRCFLHTRCDEDRIARQRARAEARALVRALGNEEALMIEPHAGGCSLAGVKAFCAEIGAKVVIDNLAIRRLGVPPAQAFDALGHAARVLHLKGFQRVGQEWRHRPLALRDFPSESALARAPELRAAVVETRGGSHWRDLRLLRAWRDARNW